MLVFRNVTYLLMLGSLVAAFGWMRFEVNQAESRPIIGGSGGGAASLPPALQRVWASDTRELLDYVRFVELERPIITEAQSLPDSLMPRVENERASLLNELEAGMTRDEVTELLGEPETIGDDLNTWVYDIATILFDDHGVAGWLETADETQMTSSLGDALAPWGPGDTSDRMMEQRRTRPQIISSSPRPSGAASGTSGYRRPLDRVLSRTRAGHGRYTGAYRKPAYLRNMFRTTPTGRRQGTPPPYDRHPY